MKNVGLFTLALLMGLNLGVYAAPRAQAVDLPQLSELVRELRSIRQVLSGHCK